LAELIEDAARSGACGIAVNALGRLEKRASAAGTNWALGVHARSQALLSDGEAAETLLQRRDSQAEIITANTECRRHAHGLGICDERQAHNLVVRSDHRMCLGQPATQSFELLGRPTALAVFTRQVGDYAGRARPIRAA
jgi:hypothetical protein